MCLKKNVKLIKKKKYRLSNDYFLFNKKYNIDFFLNSKKKGEWFFRSKNKTFIYGSKGNSFFLNNEKKLNPINKDLFLKIAKKKRIPIIMNFYEDKKHKTLKKKHFLSIKKRRNKDFLFFLEKNIDQYFSNIPKRKINLIEEISKLIIKTHTILFQSIYLNNKELADLYFYKDYYTMGMYLPKNNLIKYYKYDKFLKVEKKFFNFYKKKLMQNKLKIKLKNQRIDLYEISNFYNYTIAGSTNIAKALSYILCLIVENYHSIDHFKKKNKSISTETLSTYIINEFYRFIPIVNNQMTSPFLYRQAKEDIFYNNKILIKKNEYLWFFNTLEYFDPKIFKLPHIFDPLRWKNKKLILPYKTFGVGTHACCGTFFADKWLHLLLVNFLRKVEIQKSPILLHKQYNPNVKKIFKSYLNVKISKKKQ